MLHADLVLCKCWCCCWCNEGWDHWWESASEGSEECAGEDKEGETDGCLLAFSENKSVDYRWRLANVCVFVLFSRSKWHQPVTPALRVWDFNQCSVSLGYGKSVLRVGRVETTSIVSDFPPLEVGNFSPRTSLVSSCTDAGMARLRSTVSTVTDVVGRQRLRSAIQQMMVVPRHWLSTVGRRAFTVQGPIVWNSLSDDLAHSRTMRPSGLGLVRFNVPLDT